VEYGAGPLPVGPGFSLDNVELNRISAGHVKIGELSTGPIRVTETIAITPDLSLLAAEQIAIEGNTGTTGDLFIGSAQGVTSDGGRTLTGHSVTVDADIESHGDLTVVTQGSLDLKRRPLWGPEPWRSPPAARWICGASPAAESGSPECQRTIRFF